MNNLILIWMRWSWKSYFWNALSKILWYNFIDTDKQIEKKFWIKINQLIENYWWHKFRKLEKNFLKSISKIKKNVISTWWWMPCYYDNIKNLKHLGFIVWLNANSWYLSKWLKNDKNKRPSLTWKDINDELDEIIKQREKFYKKCSNFQIDLESINNEKIILKMIIVEYKKFCKTESLKI